MVTRGTAFLNVQWLPVAMLQKFRLLNAPPRGGDYCYRGGNHLFENSSIQSLKQTTYSPRMVDGIPGEVK